MNDFDYDVFEDAEELSPMYDESYSSANLWYDDEDAEEVVSVGELWEMCIEPTMRDGFVHIGKLLMWCFLFRASTQLVQVPPLVCHAVSAGSGLLILHHFFKFTMSYIIGFMVVAYIILLLISHLLKKYRGPIMGTICIVFLVICELFFVKRADWHKIRGAQMLVAMKVISVAFDTDIGTLQSLPSLVEFSGYVLCVGTCVFGPWVPYRDYIAIYNKPLWNYQWVWRIVSSIILALLFLSISTCWMQWLIPDESWRWWVAYRDALSFRSSHYFVSFLSEASAVTSGFGHHDITLWTLTVARPQYIEMPRSLVQVVVFWNMPMHHWLKTYIFRTTKSFGSFPAILSTYAVSSLLHGLNFQLAAVLLSLGAYTYTEYVLRQKLASVFGACIQVRPCRKDCSHRSKDKQFLVVLANIGFGILAMFHLSYLGVMFDVSSKLQDEGYNYMHTISKWSTLNYASHWVALFTYIFYLLV
ncbi:protein-serine O-palmitoleoyltransferase porcupine [Hetaerina americana]|uniref:protein-serine O-palmitoleoyltransferase porcupine n=1 Tax=Hetaerina americana TaxID=62018 RepID=UPI003A7F44B3